MTLAIVSTALLVTALVLGLQIGDGQSPDIVVQKRVSSHFLISLLTLCVVTLVHAICLTYFMGTGRWLEETGNAYNLSSEHYVEGKRLKYSCIMQMTVCFLLMLLTGGLGAASDAASPIQFKGWLGMSAAMTHLTIAVLSLLINVWVNWNEYIAIRRNGELVNLVVQRVREIRSERGLPV